MTLIIHIKSSAGPKFTLETEPETSVGDFKQLLSKQADVPANQIRLIYKGRILKDEQTLLSYGVESDHTIHMVRSAQSGTAAAAPSPAAAAAAAPAPAPTTTASATAPPANPFNMFGAGGAADPLAGLGGMGGFGGMGGGMPNMEQMQRQMMANPDMMREVMNSPMMQNLMNNPELMRSIMLSNPALRDVLDRNPELNHVFNDPQTLRQTMEMARNPELMREMTRNTDRAMSNIEAHPEGFNALRRMYQNVQEPLMNAAAQGATDQAANPFANMFAAGQGQNVPPTGPLPNPWARTSPTAGTTPTTPGTGTAPAPPAGTAPTGGAAANPFASMFGGMGGMEGLPNVDPNSMQQMLQNPAIQQMMSSMFSNPELMMSMMNSNPFVREAMTANPQLREMMSNPAFLRQMSDPRTLQSIMQMQQAMSHLQSIGLAPPMPMPGFPPAAPAAPGATAGAPGSTPADAAAPGTAPPAPAYPFDFSQLFAALGNPAAVPPVPPQPQGPPEEVYRTQLERLEEMGFGDRSLNITALQATNGNIQLAIERLLGAI